MAEDESEYARRLLLELYEGRIRRLAVIGLVGLAVAIIFLFVVPNAWVEHQHPVLRLLIRLLDRAAVVAFAACTFVLIPMTWFARTQAKLRVAGDTLPSRYRAYAWCAVATAFLLFVAIVWFTVSRGLTQLR